MPARWLATLTIAAIATACVPLDNRSSNDSASNATVDQLSRQVATLAERVPELESKNALLRASHAAESQQDDVQLAGLDLSSTAPSMDDTGALLVVVEKGGTTYHVPTCARAIGGIAVSRTTAAALFCPVCPLCHPDTAPVSALLRPGTEKASGFLTLPTRSAWQPPAQNGSYYGQFNSSGIPKTVHVNGYFRKDGTYVQSHYRSRPHH
jgi:outer membrane murein-binding lipoprotein Lpp